MTLYAIKPWFQARLAGRATALVRWRVHPDAITLAGLGCALLAGGLLAATGVAVQPARWALLLVPLLLLLRTACNALDGLVARRAGLARPSGAMLNEVADRLADLACFGGLLASGAVDLRLGAALLALLLLVSYLGVLPQALGGARRYDGPLGKADRMLALSLYSLAAPIAWGVGVAPALLGNGFAALLVGGLLATAVLRLRRAWGELGARADSAPRDA